MVGPRNFVKIYQYFTALVRSTTGGYVFTGMCLFAGGWRYPAYWSLISGAREEVVPWSLVPGHFGRRGHGEQPCPSPNHDQDTGTTPTHPSPGSHPTRTRTGLPPPHPHAPALQAVDRIYWLLSFHAGSLPCPS